MVDNGDFGSSDVQLFLCVSDNDFLESNRGEKGISLPFVLSNIHLIIMERRVFELLNCCFERRHCILYKGDEYYISILRFMFYLTIIRRDSVNLRRIIVLV